ncbi:MAG: glycosyltransferase family 9 protein [Planctomycetota bacterium]
MSDLDVPPGPEGAPRRVLIVRMSHLGDIAQTLVLAHSVRERWPEAELTWAVQPEFAPLVAPLARVVPFDRRGGLGAWRRLRAAFAATPPDLVLDAQGNWKSAMVARLARPSRGRSLAFARSAWQEPIAAAITRPVEVAAAGQRHLVARCRALAEAATGRPASDRIDPDLTADELRVGREALAGLVPEGAPVVLHPGVAGDPRSWPAERFAETARRLARDGRAVLVLTGPGEADAGEELRESASDAAHLVGQRGLRELAALLAAAAERSGRIVVGDSGPAHVAASVGLPVVLVAGPEDPLRTGPWPPADEPSSPHRVARAPRAFGDAPWRPRPIDIVEIDDVLEAI